MFEGKGKEETVSTVRPTPWRGNDQRRLGQKKGVWSPIIGS